jgi:homoserine O-succinyltransferase
LGRRSTQLELDETAEGQCAGIAEDFMPLIIDGGRVPPGWRDRKSSGRVVSIDGRASRTEGVSLALINNMPDPALEDTELQFFELLDIASGDVPVFIKLYSLTGIPRTDRGERHLNSFYWPLDDLWNSRCDGLIMTGTEPRSPDLRDEPYWRVLTEVFDWAERNTASTILSCLAAHAGVLHSDGIPRHPLSDKQFGVFDFVKAVDHQLDNQLIGGTSETVCFPHSRWNEVRADELTASGYLVLTQSTEGGVDTFVKKKKQSLFVHFQGHPEYSSHTLLKEYRRDIKRFLRGERETYPSMPKGYFDTGATALLNGFQEIVGCDRRQELLESFPEAAVVGSLQHKWHATAVSVYTNWLQHLMRKKADASVFSTVAAADQQTSRKGSALL